MSTVAAVEESDHTDRTAAAAPKEEEEEGQEEQPKQHEDSATGPPAVTIGDAPVPPPEPQQPWQPWATTYTAGYECDPVSAQTLGLRLQFQQAAAFNQQAALFNPNTAAMLAQSSAWRHQQGMYNHGLLQLAGIPGVSSMSPFSLQNQALFEARLSNAVPPLSMNSNSALAPLASSAGPPVVGEAGASGQHPSVPLYLTSQDDITLSKYQCIARKNMEFFEAAAKDVESNSQGRNRAIVMGQVGIRCRHCTMLHPKRRGRGAVYYPAKLSGIYQSAQNMATVHICSACPHVPVHVRRELVDLRGRGVPKSSTGGGKAYWAQSASVLGVVEDNGILRFAARTTLHTAETAS